MEKIFVAIEGPDGVGKTSCGELLSASINGIYRKVPAGIFMEMKETVHRIDNLDARFLFFLSANLHVSDMIRRLLGESSVVCDRYLASTFAYHKAFGANTNIANWQILKQSLIQPDFTFILEADDQVLFERLKEKGDSVEKFWNKVAMRQEIRKNYLDFSKDIIRIDTNKKTANEVCEEMLQIIKTR